MSVQPKSASTVMVLRTAASRPQVEVLMVRRTVKSEFMPDLFVFPGGSVHPEDMSMEEIVYFIKRFNPTMEQGKTGLGTGLRIAALRELFEETGYLYAWNYSSDSAIGMKEAHQTRLETKTDGLRTILVNHKIQLDTGSLVYVDHWLTPPSMPKRYDTHFFLLPFAPTLNQQVPEADLEETSSLLWVTPQDAIERNQVGDFPLALPTYIQLLRLMPYTSAEEAIESCQRMVEEQGISRKDPQITERDGHKYVSIAEYPDISWLLQE